MVRKFLVASASLGALALVPGWASAQADAPVALEGIIVTGEKVARSLQETPSSVAVTTSRRAQEENIQTLPEVLQRTANVAQTYGDAGFTIRGISDDGVSSGGDAPLATIYVDGAALPNAIVGSGPTDTWDISQIEIFRGPQSTLQGLNALAGAIVIRTQDPTFDWSFKARASYATANTTSYAVAGGGPILPDELAFRVAAEKRASDGFIDNVTRGEPEAPVESTNLRGKLLWTPAALPGFEARLGYTHFERDGGYTFTYANTTVPDYFDNRISTSDYPNRSRTEADIFNLELSYALGERMTLNTVSNYNEVSNYRSYDGDNTAEPTSYGMNDLRYEAFSQELRLNYDGERLSGLVGAYYYHRDQQNRSESLTLVPTPIGTATQLLQAAGLDAATAAYVAGLYGAALPQIPVNYTGVLPMEVETMAIFGDARFKLTDRLSILAGARFDRETNIVTVTQTTEFVGVYPDPALYGALAPAIAGLNAGVADLVAQASGATPTTERTFDAFLPKLGVEMAWTDDLVTSFLIQRGYRSGGTSANTARSQAFSYDPEYTWNYELSLRSTWLDGSLTLNANAFYIDWKNQQTSVNFGLNLYDYHTVNAGSSHVYGFEVEAAHRVSRRFDWYASIGHSRTKFDEFVTTVGAVTDLSGLEFAYAPHWTIAGGANIRFGSGVSLNVNANYRSEVFSDVGRPQAAYRLAGRTLVNAQLGYDAGRWSASLFANNLLDEEYIQYDNVSSGVALLGDPRVVGVMLEARF